MTQLDSESQYIQKIFSDFEQILQLNFNAAQEFITDLQNLASELDKIAPACNLAGLEAQIQTILSPEGKSILMKNYFKNMSKISTDITALNTCNTNFYSCGKSLGNAVQLLIGFTLNLSPSLKQDGNFDWYNGFLAGLSKNGVSQCVTNYMGLEPEFTNIATIMAKLEAGNIFVIKSLVNAIVKVETQALSWNTDCNYTQLLQILAGMQTQAGMNQVVSNYLANFNTINSDFLSPGRMTCETPYECGHNIGEAIRLLFGWGI